MNIFLTSAYESHGQLDVLRMLAGTDSSGRHRVVDSAEQADAILFVENAQFDDYFYKALKNHPLVQKYPEKVFMYNEVDTPWCTLPGLYCSMPSRHFNHEKQMAFPYLSNPNPHISGIYRQSTSRRWLFGFVGSASHKVRWDILALSHPEAAIHDTSAFDAWRCNELVRSPETRLYAEVMAGSDFILCPRGLGTSSSRLFESLEAGRAPVIVSDNWVAPKHIDWSFAVRVSEWNVHTIPSLLESIQDEAADRGHAARQAWESAYAELTLFDTLVDSLEILLRKRQRYTRLSTGGEILHRTRLQLTHTVMEVAKKLRNGLRLSPNDTCRAQLFDPTASSPHGRSITATGDRR